MLLLEKKAKCPLCGAKNPVGASRCGICTRPLENDPLPSQAVYQEALWATRIASKGARKKTNPYAILAVLAIGAVLLNYFVVGYGPSWAHEPTQVAKGSEWKVFRDQPDYVADLPGTPMMTTSTAFGASLTTATVWVDDHWDLVRDADTQSVGRLADARTKVHAGLSLASGPAPADPAAALTAIVQSLQPKSILQPGGVEVVQDPAFGQELTLTTEFNGFPEDADHGVVRATATVANGKIWVVASFVRGGDDPDLHARLTKHFVPAGAPSR